jgi:hypothetical protein
MNFKAFFAWSEDLEVRQESLGSFAESSGATPDEDGFVWGDGLYLILHFDLMNIGPAGPVDRGAVYDAINGCVETNHGTRLGGSVYSAPLLPLMSSQRCASLFWNTLCDTLGGHLIGGDSFYLHYAPAFRNLMGGIAQVVPVGKTSLDHVQVPIA